MPWNPSPESLDHLPALRLAAERLRAAGYGDDVPRRLGAVGGPGWIDAARATIASGAFAPTLASAVRLMLLGDAIPVDEARGVLGEAGLDALTRAGLAIADAGAVRVEAMITPFAGLLVASDRAPDRDLRGLAADYVLPVNITSQVLADLTVRSPGGLTVEMGSGQGYLAALAGREGGRVVTSDVNPRALAMTRATLALSGIERAEVRAGSLLEPFADVRGSVDTFISNPPFVLGGSQAPVALSGPNEGDGLFEHLVREAPGLLKIGGWATVVGAWITHDPADWSARPRQWRSACPGDSIIFRFEQHAPRGYYEQWLAGTTGDPGEAGWADVCARRSIASVCIGAVVFRRHDGANWCRTQLANIRGRFGSASDQLRTIFDSTTRLQSLRNPADLLDWRLRFVSDRRIVLPDAGSSGRPQLVHTRGLALPVPLDPRAESSLEQFDGRSRAGDVLAQLAWAGKTSGGSTSPEALQSLATLVLMGFLVPVDG